MGEIYRQHEAPQQFDAAKARMEYAKAAGISENVVNQHQAPDVRVDVAALVVDKQTGKATTLEPVQRQENAEAGESQLAESQQVDTEQLAEELQERGAFDPKQQEVVLVDMRPATGQAFPKAMAA